MAAELSRANAQYAVICEDDLQEPTGGGVPSGKFSMEPPEILPKALGEERVLLLGSRSDLTANDQKIIERFSRQGGACALARRPNPRRPAL